MGTGMTYFCSRACRQHTRLCLRERLHKQNRKWVVGGEWGIEAVRGNTRFTKRSPVNLNIYERWRRALHDFGLCTPARRESSCEGKHTCQRISDGQVV